MSTLLVAQGSDATLKRLQNPAHVVKHAKSLTGFLMLIELSFDCLKEIRVLHWNEIRTNVWLALAEHTTN